MICPYNKGLAIETIRDIETWRITKVVIHKKWFYKDESICTSVAMGKGCKYWDWYNNRCKLGWDEKKLDEFIESIKEQLNAKGIVVEVV